MHNLTDNILYFIDTYEGGIHALADRLQVDTEVLVDWAQGNAEPGIAELIQLSEALNVSIDRLIRAPIGHYPQAANIRMLVLDVDGVLTDGGIYMTERGDEFKRFHARDGRGIMTALKRGLEVAFLSNSKHPEAVLERAKRLGVKRVYVGNGAKETILDGWLSEMGLDYSQIAHIGDDANDLQVLSRVGFSACPSDAAPKNKAAVHIVLQTPGGQGCVREFIEDYLRIDVD